MHWIFPREWFLFLFCAPLSLRALWHIGVLWFRLGSSISSGLTIYKRCFFWVEPWKKKKKRFFGPPSWTPARALMPLASSAQALFQAPFQDPSAGQACIGNPLTAACGEPASCLQNLPSEEVNGGGRAHALMHATRPCTAYSCIHTCMYSHI